MKLLPLLGPECTSVLPPSFLVTFVSAEPVPAWVAAVCVRRAGSVTSVPVILVTFPLGGHGPVPGNCITHAPGLRAGCWVMGAPVPKQSFW